MRSLAVILFFLPLVAQAQSVWNVHTIYNKSGRDVAAITQVAEGGEIFVAAQLTDGVESRLYLKKWDVALGALSSRINISNDVLGNPRLDTTGGEQYLPSLAIDTGTDLLVSTKADAVGFGPTIENPVLGRTFPFPYADDPPLFIDDDSGVGSIQKRKHSSLAVNATADTAFACWTVDDGNDDTYCRSRSLTSTVWSNPTFALGATAAVEEHVAVEVLDDGTRVAIFADGSAHGVADSTNLSVHFFDASDTALGSAELGETRSNWPHLVREGDVLHATWLNTAQDEITYGTCDTAALDCTSAMNWTVELINNIPNDAAYPQIAVDEYGHVYVAFTHTSGVGDQRVIVTARCSANDWQGETVDGSEGQENLGGEHVRHAYPAIAYEATAEKISVVYGRQNLATLEIDGVRAGQDTNNFFTAMCP